MLHEMGLFLGKKFHPLTFESQFFQGLNKWILAASGASMSVPSAVSYLWQDTDMKQFIKKLIRMVLKSPHAVSYLGVRNYLKYRSPERLDFPWGWKDPRTTFTLPIWLEIFPKTKIIHIMRHGVDVARSMKEQHDDTIRAIQGNSRRWGRGYALYWMMKYMQRRKELVPMRMSSLLGAFELWEEYTIEARKHVTNRKDRAIEIRYEDLVQDPFPILYRLNQFCNLQADEESIHRAAQLARKDRAFAYRRDPELKAFADQVSDRLRKHGY